VVVAVVVVGVVGEVGVFGVFVVFVVLGVDGVLEIASVLAPNLNLEVLPLSLDLEFLETLDGESFLSRAGKVRVRLDSGWLLCISA